MSMPSLIIHSHLVSQKNIVKWRTIQFEIRVVHELLFEKFVVISMIMKSLTETSLNRNVNQYTWRRPWTRYSYSHSHSSSNRRFMACVHFLRGAKYISLAPDKIPTAGSIKITIANSQKSSWQKVWIISHIRQVSQVSQDVFYKSPTKVGGLKTFGRIKNLENQKKLRAKEGERTKQLGGQTRCS